MDNEELFKLVNNYLNGDDYSFTLFYNKTKNKVFANIYSYVKNSAIAEDILSETYIRFMNQTKKIRDDKSILGLLYVIGRNLAINYLNRNPINEDFEDHSKKLVSTNTATRNIECEEIVIKMKELLSDDMFKVVIMRLINDMEYKEIAKILKKKEGTIRSLYSEGIKKVKEGIRC